MQKDEKTSGAYVPTPGKKEKQVTLSTLTYGSFFRMPWAKMEEILTPSDDPEKETLWMVVEQKEPRDPSWVTIVSIAGIPRKMDAHTKVVHHKITTQIHAAEEVAETD